MSTAVPLGDIFRYAYLIRSILTMARIQGLAQLDAMRRVAQFFRTYLLKAA